MSANIVSLITDTAGQIGFNPRRVKMVTRDGLSTITTAGYLNALTLQGSSIEPTDILDVIYSYVDATNSGTYAVFLPTFSNGVITLSLDVNEGNVTLPVVSGNFANFSGTTGLLADAGFSPTNAAKTKVVMAGSAVVANHIALFQDTSGTIDDTAATAINNGPIQAGLSGTAGTLASFPATASKGSLKLTAVANTGDTVTTISNVAMGQASVVSIPDPATATANFVVAPAALVSGNLVKASGTAGLVVDAAFAVHAGTTAAYAGGGTSNAFTTTNMTSSSIVTAAILAQTNTSSIVKAVPGTNTLTVTFSADPGANTTVNWISITPAVA